MSIGDQNENKPIGGLYTIRLTIDGLRHQVIQAIMDHDGSLRKSVEHEVSAVVSQFDFAAAVRRDTETVLREILRRNIDEAVNTAFRVVARDLQNLVRRSLIAELTKDPPL